MMIVMTITVKSMIIDSCSGIIVLDKMLLSLKNVLNTCHYIHSPKQSWSLTHSNIEIPNGKVNAPAR